MSSDAWRGLFLGVILGGVAFFVLGHWVGFHKGIQLGYQKGVTESGVKMLDDVLRNARERRNQK